MNPPLRNQIHNRVPLIIVLSYILAVIPGECFTQPDSMVASNVLKKLSLEDLMSIEVTSVAKRPQRLGEVASAVQVITREDILNSGAKTLVEALRLFPNLQFAQVNASQWAISARGFNNVLANKLLVLINGRTVYTPLYAGVFWDVQNVLLEDIERIEVISGPGGTLWGANAVNGVINVITRSSAITQGLFFEAGAGTNLRGMGSLRYGGKINNNLTYKVYGTAFKLGNTLNMDGTKANDQWPMVQGGFRFDWDPSEKNKLSIQSNIYKGKPNPDAADTSVTAKGDNLVARWNHHSSDRSDLQLQFYYDHRDRDFGNGFTENLKTYDLDWQHNFQLCRNHRLAWGMNFRLMDHKTTNLQLFEFLPEHKTLWLYSLYAQDDITLVKERLRFTIGSKIEHNTYTGFEFQPNGRLTWTPTKTQTVWAAISRAVRTPARIDRDFYLSLAPGLPFIRGNPDYTSEVMQAYELGWRMQPLKTLSISIATFYNHYDRIRSVEPGPSPLFIPIFFGNGVKGHSYGFELSSTCQVTEWWKLRGGYTYLTKKLSVKSDSKDMNEASAESDDPRHQFVIQSSMELNRRLELGTVIRYASRLPDPSVPGYMGLDLRVGWKIGKSVELDLVGQDLLDRRHIEFIPSNPEPRQIKRGFYGKIICRF